MIIHNRFLNKLRHFDNFNKVDDDFVVKTKSGGLLSILVYVFIAYLVISETVSFIKPEVAHQLTVDNSVSQLEDNAILTFNITFHRLPCALLTLDVLDASGHAEIDVEDSIKKTVIPNQNIKPIPPTDVLNPNYCGSCYDTTTEGSKCCNTCAEVLKHYAKKKWNTGDISKFEQCVREGLSQGISADGCNIAGTVTFSKILSSFHISPGPSIQHGNQHVHSLTPDSVKYNTSHIIHTLYIGKEQKEVGYLLPSSPLDDYDSVNINHPSFMTKYFLKLVNTQVSSHRFSQSKKTYIYSVSKSEMKVDGVNPSAFPGVYFQVDFTGISVKIRESRKSFSHFFLHIVSIIGGVFCFAQVLSSWIHSSVRVVQKQRIGKLS
ncbi:hypothetical protein RCL1_000098 [Eukaryota sp. TZLM3-RCL]